MFWLDKREYPTFEAAAIWADPADPILEEMHHWEIARTWHLVPNTPTLD